MADNENNDDFEEEFNFDEEELSEESSEENLETEPEPSPTPEAKPEGKRKIPWLFVAIIVAIVGYFGWKLLSLGTPSSDVGEIVAPPAQPTAPQPIQAEQPSPQPPSDQALTQAQTPDLFAAQPVPEPKVEPSVPFDEMLSKATGDIEKTVDIIKKELGRSSKAQDIKIRAVEQDLELNAQRLVSLDKQFITLQQDLVRLIQAIKALRADVADLQEARIQAHAERAAKARAAAQTRTSEADMNPTISVHAIIPGRAWLKTKDGKTLSVTEGDVLNEYGKVLKIDPISGTVSTTSGTTLR